MTEPLFIGMPDSYDYVFDGHAGASPSGAERWMHCTASLQASREFLETLSPNQRLAFAEGSSAARQGTTAHAVAEVKLSVMLGQMDEDEAATTMLELTAMPEDGEEYTDEMDEAVQHYVDLVQQFIDAGREVRIEQRLHAVIPLVDEYEGQTHTIPGSGDTVIPPAKGAPTLTVVDLKFGEGVNVEAKENPQLRIYALGALDELVDDEGNLAVDIEDVEYYIAQPRNGGIKTWSESLDDLLAWRDEVLAPALTSALHDPVDLPSQFAPSDDVCQWCPAKGGCAALAEQRVASAADLFDVIVEAEYVDGPGAFPETATLSDERLGSLLTQITGLVKIHKDLKEEAERRLHRGVTVPGFELKNYSPQRKWVEGAQDEIAARSINRVFKEPTLMTPTQALLAVAEANEEDKAFIESLIVKPDIRPVISTGPSDKRKTWAGKPPEQMFDNETGDE